MRIILLVLVWLAWNTLAAAVIWETTSVSAVATLEDEQVVAEYPFRVEGGVRVLAIEPSCSCLEVTADRSEYADGDAGVVRVVMTMGGRTGMQRKPVTIRLDTPGATEQILHLQVDIPHAFELSDTVVRWTADDRLVAKRVRVTVADPYRVTRVKAESLHAHIGATVEVIEEGRVYDIVIQPQERAKGVVTRIIIRTDHPIQLRNYALILAQTP